LAKCSNSRLAYITLMVRWCRAANGTKVQKRTAKCGRKVTSSGACWTWQTKLSVS